MVIVCMLNDVAGLLGIEGLTVIVHVPHPRHNPVGVGARGTAVEEEHCTLDEVPADRGVGEGLQVPHLDVKGINHHRAVFVSDADGDGVDAMVHVGVLSLISQCVPGEIDPIVVKVPIHLDQIIREGRYARGDLNQGALVHYGGGYYLGNGLAVYDGHVHVGDGRRAVVVPHSQGNGVHVVVHVGEARRDAGRLHIERTVEMEVPLVGYKVVREGG